MQRERQRSGAPLIRDRREGGGCNGPRKSGSPDLRSMSADPGRPEIGVCSASFRFAPCCAAPGTRAYLSAYGVKPAGDAREWVSAESMRAGTALAAARQAVFKDGRKTANIRSGRSDLGTGIH